MQRVMPSLHPEEREPAPEVPPDIALRAGFGFVTIDARCNRTGWSSPTTVKFGSQLRLDL